MKLIQIIREIELLEKCISSLDDLLSDAYEHDRDEVSISTNTLDYISLQLTKFSKLKCEQEIKFDENLGRLYE